MADVTPLHKKVRKIYKKTTGQLVFSQYFRKYSKGACLHKYLFFFDKFLPKQQFGFRNRYSTQQCLLVLLEK